MSLSKTSNPVSVINLDSQGRILYYENPKGYKVWYEWNEYGSLSNLKTSCGYEERREYDGENLIKVTINQYKELWFLKGEIVDDPAIVLLLKAKIQKHKDDYETIR